MISRRTTFLGLGGLLVAPAIVRASSLMKLSVPITKTGFTDLQLTLLLQKLRQHEAERIAHDILSVQPISLQLMTDLWNLMSWSNF